MLFFITIKKLFILKDMLKTALNDISKCLLCRSHSTSRQSFWISWLIVQRHCTNNSTKNDFENNPYFEKYSRRITEMKSSKPSEFQLRLDKLNEKNNYLNPPSGSFKRDAPKKPNNKNQPAHTRSKNLNDILKLDMVENLPPEEISNLWIEHFHNEDGISAVIPGSVYEEMQARSLEYPTFLYPLVRGTGYEFIVGQFSGHSCYFTSLANFQVHKDNSPVCLTITHFPELKDIKSIVLMHGEFDSDIMNVTEAQFLANQVQLYYSSANEKKKQLLETFNKNPQNFRHTDLIKELETVQ